MIKSVLFVRPLMVFENVDLIVNKIKTKFWLAFTILPSKNISVSLFTNEERTCVLIFFVFSHLSKLFEFATKSLHFVVMRLNQ
jgi:hypothetical protein